MDKKQTPKASPGLVVQDQAPIYSEQPVRSLPGLLRKHAVVQPTEFCLVLEKGQVERTLSPGVHTVGWSVLDTGQSYRSVGRLRRDAFSLPLRFYRLGDDTNEPLDAFSEATVVVTDPITFYKFAAAGRPHLTSRQLGGAVSAAVQVILDRLAAWPQFGPSALKSDPAKGEELTNLVADNLGGHLREKGLRLQKVNPLLFRPSRETEALVEEALTLQSELASAAREDRTKFREKVELFASRALEIELASSSEVDVLRAAAGGSSDDPAGILVDFVQNCVGRLTGQAADRARRLPVGRPPSTAAGPYRVSLAWLDALLGWIVLGAVIAAVLVAPPVLLMFKDRIDLDPRLFVGGAYGALVGVITIAQFCRWAVQRWEQWRRKQREQETSEPTWFERWLSTDAARVDETIRHQIASELEQGPVVDLREAARASHAESKTQDAQALRRLGEDVRYLAQLVRSAEYASSALRLNSRDALQRGARLVSFEEESLRLARILTAQAKDLRTKAQTDAAALADVSKVSDASDALRRHFSNRTVMIAGGLTPALSAKPQNT